MVLLYKSNYFEKYTYAYLQAIHVGGKLLSRNCETGGDLKPEAIWSVHDVINLETESRFDAQCRRDSCFMICLIPVGVLLYFISSLTYTSLDFHTFSHYLSTQRLAGLSVYWLMIKKGVWIESHCLMKTNCYEDRSRIVFSYVTSPLGPFLVRIKCCLRYFSLPLPHIYLLVSNQTFFLLLIL